MTIRTLSTTFALLVLALAGLSRGEDAAAPTVPPDAAASGGMPPVALPPEPGLKAGCVIMRDGRTFVGDVTSVADGYAIRLVQGGRFVVPYDQVRLTAADVKEAYRKQKETMKNGSASEVAGLGRWCFEQKLYDEGRAECLQAIRLEPNRADLRQLLLRIDAATGQANVGELPEMSVVPAATPPPVRSASAAAPVGVSPRSNADFVRMIQPLLMNTCGNAACHAAKSETEFRIMAVRPGQGSQRFQSQHNLEQVLRQITSAEPESSPLLTVTRNTKAGDPHHGVFDGRRGTMQFDLLKEWVVRVSREKSGAGTVAAGGKSAPQRLVPIPRGAERSIVIKPRAADGDEVSEGGNPRGIVLTSGERRAEEAVPAQSGEQSDEDLLRDVRRESLPDPFDPDEFNRSVHGKTAAELRGAP